MCGLDFRKLIKMESLAWEGSRITKYLPSQHWVVWCEIIPYLLGLEYSKEEEKYIKYISSFLLILPPQRLYATIELFRKRKQKYGLHSAGKNIQTSAAAPDGSYTSLLLNHLLNSSGAQWVMGISLVFPNVLFYLKNIGIVKKKKKKGLSMSVRFHFRWVC